MPLSLPIPTPYPISLLLPRDWLYLISSFALRPILVLKKCKKPDDVLFINAAEHFVKGKRQNQLSAEHIAKIIDTYQNRTEAPRYSRRVDMAEIVFMNGTLGQLPELFTLADDFTSNMRTNLIASIVPGVLGIAGTLLFGWGMGICVLLSQGSTPVGVYNAVKPMLDEQKHPSTSIALIQKHTLM